MSNSPTKFFIEGLATTGTSENWKTEKVSVPVIAVPHKNKN